MYNKHYNELEQVIQFNRNTHISDLLILPLSQWSFARLMKQREKYSELLTDYSIIV